MAPSFAQFVEWFRSVAPYLHDFTGKTFVIGFGGELVDNGILLALAQDIALLHTMGIKVVLVHGSRPQVKQLLHLRQHEAKVYEGIRATDSIALECAKEAAGEIRLDIEAAFSQSLVNTAMANARVRVVSGNFVTAQPLGIINGFDYGHTGKVRKIDTQAIASILDSHSIVVLSPLGFSPTGEAFNLTMEEVATQTAIKLDAEKLIFLTHTNGLLDVEGEMIQEISMASATELLIQKPLHFHEDDLKYLEHALKACSKGVERSHVIPTNIDGQVLLELFTHDGIGTMLVEENLESLRRATFDDVGGILKLIEPLEQEGVLVRRGRETIEREYEQFSVIEHDGVVFGCAALYPFYDKNMGEMSCLAIDPTVQGMGDGQRLLNHVEQHAKMLGLEKIFVLTTHTSHWFLKRGFQEGLVSELPNNRQKLYNWNRKSRVLIKKL